MRLDDGEIELTDDVHDSIDIEYSSGPPEKGHKADIDDEQWRDSIARTNVREAYRELCKSYVDLTMDNRRETPHPKELLELENIDTIYFSQYPWRVPFMAIELKECPSWANITVTKEAPVRTHPAHSLEDTAIRFQVRDSW